MADKIPPAITATVACSIILLCTFPAEAQLGGFFSSGPKVAEIKTSDLATLLDDHSKAVAKAKEADASIPKAEFVVVDVRSKAEVDVSLIPGAITKAEYESQPSAYKNKLVIPYCTVGGRSGAYAKKLAGKGVTVKNYKGSILGWVEAELPLVTPQGKPTNRIHTYSDRYKVPAKYKQVTGK